LGKIIQPEGRSTTNTDDNLAATMEWNGIIIPTDELTPSFFRGVGLNHQPEENLGLHQPKLVMKKLNWG